jgi:hypothetical protein
MNIVVFQSKRKKNRQYCNIKSGNLYIIICTTKGLFIHQHIELDISGL